MHNSIIEIPMHNVYEYINLLTFYFCMAKITEKIPAKFNIFYIQFPSAFLQTFSQIPCAFALCSSFEI